MKKKFTDVSYDPQLITVDCIKTERADLDKQQAETVKLCKSYLDDVAAKKARITAQLDKYTAELHELEALEKEQGAAVAQTVACGDVSEAAKLEAELDATTAKIAAVTKKRDLIQVVHIQGDAALYESCGKSMDKTVDMAESYRDRLMRLHAAVKADAERLDKIAGAINSELGYGGPFVTHPNFAREATTEYRKVERHYNDLDRKDEEVQREAAEREKAEREKREKESHTFRIF